jgi:RNA polymerase sigma-70 factor (ECF subfamily)
MNDLEREFEEMVRANRSTIYTVCYMFSQDQDEVADLFKRFLSTCGRVCQHLKGEAMCALGSSR